VAPETGVAEKEHAAFHGDERERAPDGCAVNFSERPEIVQKKENNVAVEGGNDLQQTGELQARDGGAQNDDGGKEHKALMRGAIAAKTES